MIYIIIVKYVELQPLSETVSKFVDGIGGLLQPNMQLYLNNSILDGPFPCMKLRIRSKIMKMSSNEIQKF